MSFLFPTKPVFTPSQLDRLSNIFDNAGQGFFVVFLLTQAVEGFDKINLWVLGLGTIAVAACWTASLTIAKKEVEKW